MARCSAGRRVILYTKRLQVSPDSFVARLVGCHPAKQEVASLTAGQGTCLGCRPGPQMRRMQEAIDHCFSPSLSPSPPLSLKINK